MVKGPIQAGQMSKFISSTCVTSVYDYLMIYASQIAICARMCIFEKQCHGFIYRPQNEGECLVCYYSNKRMLK